MATTHNPDWSRESMKTILAWGWVSPTGQDHVGRRKDGTHDRMAYELGLGTWVQAVKAGWVRYILFSDNHIGITLIIAPNTLAAARKLVNRPDVITVSFEWLVDGKIEQSGVLTAKLALVAIRAKGRVREQNPPYHGGGIYTGNVFSWGFISPTGMVMDGANDDSAPKGGGITHDKLARAYGLGGEGKALAKGYVRYLSGMMKSGRAEVAATIAEPWAGPAKALRKYIDVGLHGPVAHILDLDFVEKSGYTHYASIAIVGEEKIKAVLAAVGRGEDPANVRERMRVESREQNPLPLTDEHRRQARGNKFNTLVEMTPMEFLRLTTVDDHQIKEIMDTAKPLSVYNDAAATGRNIIPCHLVLDIHSGQAVVVSHEGRHRAAALFMNREEGVGLPVYLRVQSATRAQADAMLDSLPGGRDRWLWDTTYLWGWDELPGMIVGQFNKLVKVPKLRLKVVEPYVQERGRKARGL